MPVLPVLCFFNSVSLIVSKKKKKSVTRINLKRTGLQHLFEYDIIALRVGVLTPQQRARKVQSSRSVTRGVLVSAHCHLVAKICNTIMKLISFRDPLKKVCITC